MKIDPIVFGMPTPDDTFADNTDEREIVPVV